MENIRVVPELCVVESFTAPRQYGLHCSSVGAQIALRPPRLDTYQRIYAQREIWPASTRQIQTTIYLWTDWRRAFCNGSA